MNATRKPTQASLLLPEINASPAADGTSPAVRRAGFRLRRLEMLNWGTFHHQIGVVQPNGGWTLLVGENGSGKSTAVDALRTLLVEYEGIHRDTGVPPQCGDSCQSFPSS